MPYVRPAPNLQADAFDDLYAAMEDIFRRRPETTEEEAINALHDVSRDVDLAAKDGRAAA